MRANPCTAAFVSLAASALLFAQDTVSPAIRVDVSLVNVAFTARDTRGQIVTDLTRDDIEVFEDGVMKPVRFFSQSSDLPLRFALIVDVSDSQSSFNRKHRVDVEAFAKSALGPADKAMLVCFGNQILPGSDFTSSSRDLLRGLDAIVKSRSALYADATPNGIRNHGTAFFDAIYETAHTKMMQPGVRKALVVFSDGEDNASAYDIIEAIEAAQAADAPVYTVHYSDTAHISPHTRQRYGKIEMSRLAEETGGIAYDSATNVAKALAEVSSELRSLYELGYSPTNSARDGSYRKIEIRSKRPGIAIRARRGYYSR
jgi:Ca-activated chloride channel family protein